MTSKVSPQQFVTSFVRHKGDIVAIGTELGVSKHAVVLRAQSYRKKGVKLPRPHKTGIQIPVSELNALIKSLKQNSK